MSGVSAVVCGTMYTDALVTSFDYAARPLAERLDDAVALIGIAWDFRWSTYGRPSPCAFLRGLSRFAVGTHRVRVRVVVPSAPAKASSWRPNCRQE